MLHERVPAPADCIADYDAGVTLLDIQESNSHIAVAIPIAKGPDDEFLHLGRIAVRIHLSLLTNFLLTNEIFYYDLCLLPYLKATSIHFLLLVKLHDAICFHIMMKYLSDKSHSVLLNSKIG